MVRSADHITNPISKRKSDENTNNIKAPETKFRLISIRWTLPLLIIVPLATGIGLTSWIANRSSKQAVNDLVNALGDEVTKRIDSRLDDSLGHPQTVNEMLNAELLNGNLSVDDPVLLRQNLWALTRFEKLAKTIYFGSEAGDFIGVDREPDGETYFFHRDSDQGAVRNQYLLDEAGKPIELVGTRSYDPRQRPWYQPTLDLGRGTWSPVYNSASNPELTITRTLPVKSSAGETLGVFGVDVFLNGLSEFLNGLDISETGEAFIIESSGELIATSEGDPFKVVNGEQTRLLAEESPSELISLTTQKLLERYSGFSDIQQPTVIDYKVDNRRRIVHVYPVSTDLELDWLIVVAIPETDFTAVIDTNMRNTRILGLLITLGATGMGVMTSLWLVRPIARLNTAAKQIKADRYEVDSLAQVANRPDELGQLATLFNDMAIVVTSREESLANQISSLRSEMDSYSDVDAREQEAIQNLLARAQRMREALRNV